MIGSCLGLLDPGKLTEVSHSLAYKIAALVAMDSGGIPIVYEEVVVQDFCCGLGCLVLGRVGLSISRKMVNDHKNMLIPSLGSFK